jgi:probable rRNA maturation factor
VNGAAPPRPWPGSPPGPPAPGPDVAVADEQSAVRLDVPRLAELARAALADQGVIRGELSLSFVDEATMAELNGRYLAGEGPTDVLAFPLDAEPGGAAFSPAGAGGAPVLVGDVVVCPAVAERNAAARSAPTGDELALLVVHGVLHVLGMDHAEPAEGAAMQEAERRLLARHYHRSPIPEDRGG